MRLWLSSYRVGNSPISIREFVGGNGRTALVYNACDGYPRGDIWEEYQHNELERLRSVGLDPFVLDLTEYRSHPDGVHQALTGVDLVWTAGGNSFVLRRAMVASGFDSVFRELLDQDAIAYGGYSAGAISATPSLRGVECCDIPDLVPPGYDETVVWDGLGLVDYYIVPHYRCDHPESPDMEKYAEYLADNHLPYRTLADGEVIFVGD